MMNETSSSVDRLDIKDYRSRVELPSTETVAKISRAGEGLG